MNLYQLYHENSKEYCLQDELTRNAFRTKEPSERSNIQGRGDDRTELPPPDPNEQSKRIRGRSTARDFTGEPLSLKTFAALLRDAYGTPSNESTRRVVPSAGARYPLELYAAVFEVDGLEPGLYHYEPVSDSIGCLKTGDFAQEFAQYSHDQQEGYDAATMLLLGAFFERSTAVYGERGYRHALLEAGHVVQNIYLTCEAKGLGACANGGFADDDISDLFDLRDAEAPVYAVYVGHAANR